MRLSDFSTEKATDVLCEIAPYAMNILTDDELISELRKAIDLNKANTPAEKMALTIGKISKIVPIILKKRKSDLFGILGAVNEKSGEEIAKQNIIITMSQIKDITKDRELLDFFKSCTGSEGSE